MKHLVIVGVVSFFAALGSAFKIGKVLEISPFTELPNYVCTLAVIMFGLGQKVVSRLA